MSAEGQIKAFIDRILRFQRIEAETPVELAAALTGRDQRIAYVTEPLLDVSRDASVAAGRAYAMGAAMLGWNTDTIRSRLKVLKRKGSLAAVDEFYANVQQIPLWRAGDLRTDLFGYVYGMSATDFPGVVKIGFSHNPLRRLEELQYLHRINLRLEVKVVGTRFDEHLLQHRFSDRALANEWFDLDGVWRQSNPNLAFFTPDRMWKTLRGVWEAD